MTNVGIANTFDEVADLLEFTGANPFRIRAYRNAARMIRLRWGFSPRSKMNPPASV